MVITDENNKSIMIDSLHTPIVSDYFWCLDLKQQDFMLSPLKIIEEMVTPTLTLLVGGYSIDIPTGWHVLLYSEETLQLDVAKASEIARGEFEALAFDFNSNKVESLPIRVINYNKSSIIHSPTIQRNTMLCLPIGPNNWVCVSPVDVYNKYCKKLCVTDILY